MGRRGGGGAGALSVGGVVGVMAWLVGRAAGQASTTTTSSSEVLGSSPWHYCTWTKYEPQEDSPAKRHGHSLVGYQNKMVLFGGFDGAFSNTYMNDMWFWDVKPYMTPEEDPAAEGEARLDSTESIGERFDAGHWRVVKQTGMTPPGRYGHAAAVVEDTDLMVVFAGNSGEQDLLNDLWVFHLKTQLWRAYRETSGSPWPQPRSGASSTDVGGTVYVFGGWSSRDGALAELWALDVAEDGTGNPTTVSWRLVGDSCASNKERTAQPERCVAVDDAKCSAVDTAFQDCQEWTHSSTRGRQVTSCPGSSGAGAPGGDCTFFYPNGTLPSGCAGRATVCARAGDCRYTAPSISSAPCECETLADCRELEHSIAANWALEQQELQELGASGFENCSMQNGLDAVQELFDALDRDQSLYLESPEISISSIRQKVPVTVDLNRDERLTVAEYAILRGMPGPGCSAQDKDICENVTNDGTAATCESAGRCSYYPAVSARHCDIGPSARFAHAAVKVSIDLMVFGGHNGVKYLSDLWRYDTRTLVWSAITAPSENDKPISRSHPVAVPMSGGMLLWSGYTSQCNKDEIDSDQTDDEGCLVDSEGFLEDIWQFANPAGTAIETSKTQITTITQIIEISENTLIVEDKEPEWNRYTSYSAGITGHGGTSEETFGADEDGKPYARMGAAAVSLDFISGFGVFGGESQEGLLGDTWVLQCGLISNTWILLIVLGVLLFLLVCYGAIRYYLRYRRQRAALTRVTDLLKNIGRSGALNRNGIHAAAIAPLGNWSHKGGSGVDGFFVEGGVLHPPRILEYDVSKLTLSKKFVEQQKATAGSGKRNWVS